MKALAFAALALMPALALAHGDKAMNMNKMMDEGRIAAFLHQVNQEEIDAGKLAQRQGTSQDLRDYGRMLTDDHQQADKALMDAAKKDHLNLDKSVLNADDQQKLANNKTKMDQVKAMKGAEFDKSFAQTMANGHKDVIGMLRDNRDNIKSAELKKFVDATIPKLETHRDVADRISRGERAAMMGKSRQGRMADEHVMDREKAPAAPDVPAGSQDIPKK